MVGAVHGRPSEGVHPDVGADDPCVTVFDGVDTTYDVPGIPDEVPGRLHHESRRLQAVGIDLLLERPRHLGGGGVDVQGILVGPVGDTQPASQVDKLKVYVQLAADLADDVHQQFGDETKVVCVSDTGPRHHVGAETLDAGLLGHPVRVHDVLRVHAELCLRACVRDELAHVAPSVPGVYAEAQDFGAPVFEDAGQERGVVQVEDHAAVEALSDVFVGQKVAAEHDILAVQADFPCELDFRDAGGVDPGPLLSEDVGNGQVVAGLDGVEEAEVSVVFAERAEGPPEVGADSLLLVNVSRGAVLLSDGRGGYVLEGNRLAVDAHGGCFLSDWAACAAGEAARSRERGARPSAWARTMSISAA